MKVRKGLSNAILLALEKAVDGYVLLEDFAYNPGRYAYGDPDSLKKSSLAKAIKRLREGGLIEFVDDQKIAVRITQAGKDQAIWAKLNIEDSKWDGKWRMVIFDIPEKRRAARDLLRSKLKAWSFIRWQQSVWASKKNCTNELRQFIKFVRIEDWVKVLEATDVGDLNP